jgi:hypothetical protein
MRRYVEPQALELQIVACYPEATLQIAKNNTYGVIAVIDSLGGQKS